MKVFWCLSMCTVHSPAHSQLTHHDHRTILHHRKKLFQHWAKVISQIVFKLNVSKPISLIKWERLEREGFGVWNMMIECNLIIIIIWLHDDDKVDNIHIQEVSFTFIHLGEIFVNLLHVMSDKSHWFNIVNFVNEFARKKPKPNETKEKMHVNFSSRFTGTDRAPPSALNIFRIGEREQKDYTKVLNALSELRRAISDDPWDKFNKTASFT